MTFLWKVLSDRDCQRNKKVTQKPLDATGAHMSSAIKPPQYTWIEKRLYFSLQGTDTIHTKADNRKSVRILKLITENNAEKTMRSEDLQQRKTEEKNPRHYLTTVP